MELDLGARRPLTIIVRSTSWVDSCSTYHNLNRYHLLFVSTNPKLTENNAQNNRERCPSLNRTSSMDQTPCKLYKSCNPAEVLFWVRCLTFIRYDNLSGIKRSIRHCGRLHMSLENCRTDGCFLFIYPMHSASMHDNDPEVLEREKHRNLRGEQHQTSTPLKHAPGWNESLATTSEAYTKVGLPPRLLICS